MKVVVRCPHCGRSFVVDVTRRKGSGASYTVGRLGRLHVLILQVLAEFEGVGLSKRSISRVLYRRGYKYSGNSISGRLSELLALGYVRVEKAEVRVYDKRAMKFRFRKTPLWYITPEGERALREVGVTV